ncbi:hypothetical protein ACWGB8_06605 [Kitasatospora sp. NPDC054939]
MSAAAPRATDGADGPGTTVGRDGTGGTGVTGEGSSGPGRAALYGRGPHFVIAAADGPDGPGLPAELSDALARLPAAPDAVVVLAATPDAPAVLFAQLDDLARTATARGAGTLVLAASGLAAAPDGGPRPAEQVARLAGLPIVAPDGPVTLRADGTLLATDGDGPASGPGSAPGSGGSGSDSGSGSGSWWRCPPDGPARPLGPLWPPAPPTAAPTLPEGLAATPLPAGHWITREPAPPRPADGSALLRAETTAGTLLLLVGRPGETPPPADRLADAVRRLATDPATDLLLSAPWTTVADLRTLAAALAVELRRPVRAAVGLPLRTSGGHSTRLLDPDGRPTWEPWLTELTASPERRAVTASAWRGDPPGMTPRGPALFETGRPGWCAEAVPAGLWLRPYDPPADRGPRLLEPDPAGPLLIVGTEHRPVPPDLPALAERLRTALTAPATDPDAPAPRLLLRGTAPEPEPAPQPAPVPEPEPLPEAEPEAEPVPAPTPPPVTAVPAVPARTDHARHQAAFRALLGEQFQRCAARADQVAVRLPALRPGGPDDLKTDLAAVLLHHADTGAPASRSELVDAARRTDPGPLASYLACLAAGLRRLPSHHGPVLLGTDADPAALGHCTPGAVLTEPAPVIGLPAHDVDLGLPVEFAVWSFTGRRTSAVAEDDEPEVVFPPGTRFAVLDVLPGDGGPTRILLRESALRSPARPTGPDDRDQHLRQRLLTWLDRRDRLAPTERRTPSRPTRYHLTPGLPPY